MTTLEKRLAEISNSVVHSGSGTLSCYYEIGCIRVRVSDHFSTSSDGDLHIYHNGKSTYVIIPMIGTNKEVQWFNTVNDVIEFIVAFSRMARIMLKSPKTASENETNDVEEPSSVITEKRHIIEYRAWKKQFADWYAITKKYEMGAMMDSLYELYGDINPNVLVKLTSAKGRNAAQRYSLIKSLITSHKETLAA